jgi:hypothetical protein
LVARQTAAQLADGLQLQMPPDLHGQT